MEIKIENCSVRINKEPGSKVTEVQVTKNPVEGKGGINFSTYLPEGTDADSGQYDFVLTKRPDAPAKTEAFES